MSLRYNEATRFCVTIKPLDFGTVHTSQLHIFSDASGVGYGVSAYIRLCNTAGRIHCTFLMGKARLAPLKMTTIPRLKLTAATVAVRIGQQLRKELDLVLDSVIFHTDSTTVLHYILNEKKRFPIFIANRVRLIRDHSTPSQWRYVETNVNPADYASRGLDAHQIIHDRHWLNGPDFLWEPESSWTKQPVLSNDYELENSSNITCGAVTIDESSTAVNTLIEYYSSWYRLKRAVAIYQKLFKLLTRHISHRKNTEKQSVNPAISILDLEHAEMTILQITQKQHFPETRDVLNDQSSNDTGSSNQGRVLCSSAVYRLDPFLLNGILRVGGRLSKMSLPDDMKFPILLPYKSHVTTLILRDIHIRLAHSGRNHVLAELRQKYWVIHANSAVRQLISRCVTCKKLQAPVSDQKMSDLPPDRGSMDPPFTYAAVDYFGPFIVKQGRKEIKQYGALFTCLASRAIHIETTKSLDTDSFIQALRRFLARRGPVKQIRSDNGTNFVGAQRELRDALSEMDNNTIKQTLVRNSIDWIFNPPAASHMGGIWERQIRTVRKVLNQLSKEFGDQLDEESFRTLMTEVEAIVNSRPLTSVSTDPSDLNALTPSNILTMKSGVIFPPPGVFQCADIYLRKRWRRVQYLANLFWTRWKREYLLTLQQRQKWNEPKRNLHTGDLVLIKDDNLPRNSWSMARVSKTEPDRKGFVRSVMVKTTSTELRRPIHKLVLLLPTEEPSGT